MRLPILVLLVLSFIFAGQLFAQCDKDCQKDCCAKEQSACPAPGCEKGCSEVCKAVTKALKENCKVCKGNCSEACMKACTTAIMSCMSAGCTDCSKGCKAEACKAGCTDTCKMACEIACKTVASMQKEGTMECFACTCKEGVICANCKKMEEGSQPGPQHAHFKEMAGDWDTVSTFWMKPGEAPQTCKGTNTNEVIFGGRYLVQNYKGDFMGMAFEGMGITAYSNVKKQVEMVWIDSCGTGVYHSTGNCDGTGKVITLCGEDTPMPGMSFKTRDVIRIIDANKYTFEMYRTPAGGQESKVMEIVYTRAAAKSPVMK
ncbi:MAG: DUF1579 domain-containing protein [Planctomycetota bacterium]